MACSVNSVPDKELRYLQPLKQDPNTNRKSNHTSDGIAASIADMSRLTWRHEMNTRR
jgi:hypothetical protein